MNTIHWKTKLDNFGQQRIPCLFIIDYKGENGMVFPLSELPEGIEISFSEEKNNNAAPIPIEKYPIPTFKKPLIRYILTLKTAIPSL